MSEEQKAFSTTRTSRLILCGMLVIILLFVVFLSGGRSAFVLEIPFRILIGWAIHAWKALPHLFGKWQEAVLPGGSLLIGGVIAHRFVRRCVEEKFPERTWRIRYTIGSLSLLLLGSAAAIAASGVVHQMFWLAKGKLIESNTNTEWIVAVNDGRQLMFALFEFEQEKGRYPESLGELAPELIDPESLRRLSWPDLGDGKVPEPWILLEPGFDEQTIVPVILSPTIWSKDIPMVAVGYSDGTVRLVRAENLAKLLNETRRKQGELGR